jgi:hypothetical protein
MLNHHEFFVIEQEIIGFEKICILSAAKSSSLSLDTQDHETEHQHQI